MGKPWASKIRAQLQARAGRFLTREEEWHRLVLETLTEEILLAERGELVMEEMTFRIGLCDCSGRQRPAVWVPGETRLRCNACLKYICSKPEQRRPATAIEDAEDAEDVTPECKAVAQQGTMSDVH